MEKKPLFELLRALRSKRMIVVLLFGFSSGLPIMIVGSTLRVWLRRMEVDIENIGYMAWVMIPYSFNFLWACLLDRFVLSRLGRRRGWILLTQIALIASIAGLSFSDPAVSLPFVAAMAILVSFFSATQDIAIDAYRREVLPDNELGIGSALGVYGYRVAMLVSGGLALWLVDPETLNLSFNQMYLLMSGVMLVGVATTFFATEPHIESGLPKTLAASVIGPFREFLRRDGAITILLFILFFKMGDAIAGSMLSPFYVDMGYSNRQIAEVAQFFGFLSTMTGLFLGGAVIYRAGIYPSLWIFGILQGLSTTSFTLLTLPGEPYWPLLAGVVAFEDLTSGMGTAALVAFMSSMTNKQFTAAQYALFSSLASFGRTFFSGFAGMIVAFVGYAPFFLLCAALASVGLTVLYRMREIYLKATALSGAAEKEAAPAAQQR